MSKNSPEQLDWLKDEDKRRDDDLSAEAVAEEDERARLEMFYGEGAENAPLTEEERKKKKKERKAKEDAEYKELLEKLKKPFPKNID